MLVFDDGGFSEHETVLLSDIMAHTPPEIVSKNFGIGERELEGIPGEELFIFHAPVPRPLHLDQETAAGKSGSSPTDFSFRPAELNAAKKTSGGEVTIVDSSVFKASATVAVAIVTVHPGGMREDHSLSQWLSHTPPELVMAHLNIGQTTYDQISKVKLAVLPK